MFEFIWPIGLAILSNVMYHICSKSVPGNINPFASLTVTYAIAAGMSLALYFALGKGGNLMGEYRKLNWAPFVLGVVIIGLEVGFMYAYKVGWQVSKASVVQAAGLAVILIVVGAILFKEKITWNKVAGILVCLGGLGLINLK